MRWNWLKGAALRATGEPDAAGLSRRELVQGLGALGVVAAAAPALLAPSEAGAQTIEAQYGGYQAGRRRRGRRRGRARGRRHVSARELRWRCRNDWRFRRRNPGLCHRVLGWRARRRGACIQIGALTICS